MRELAPGKRVLNLFAYTCGFTVAAAAGKATRTTSVDASRGVLDWGAENMEQNGLAGAHHAMVDEDVFDWLKLANKRGERYDLVVLDPPSYATTKSSRFSAAQDLPIWPREHWGFWRREAACWRAPTTAGSSFSSFASKCQGWTTIQTDGRPESRTSPIPLIFLRPPGGSAAEDRPYHSGVGKFIAT